MKIEKLDQNMAVNISANETGIRWYTPHQKPFSLCGFPFYEENKNFYRLPHFIEPLLAQERPQLLELMRHTAGGALRFCTDSREIRVRVQLEAPAYMSHMTTAGQCGYDCYLRQPGQKDWLFAGVTKYPIQAQAYDCCVFSQPKKQTWEVLLYFPLYIGVEKIEIGLCEGASLGKGSDFSRKGAVGFYGTSVTQGGCASRPGMSYPAILGRLLDCEVYNWGFSGNGMANAFLGPIFTSLAELRLLAVDIEDNAGPANLLEQNLPAFLDAVRTTAPQLPVLVISGTSQPRENWDMTFRQKKSQWCEFQRIEVLGRQERGDNHIYFFDGHLLPMDDATVDGVHLTDLGFSRTADALFPILQQIM